MKTFAYITEELNAPFKLEEVDLNELLPEEILVEVTAVGICHTDESARIGIIPVPMPMVLGHEGAGIVVEKGSAVTDFEVGDHVAVSFGYCGKCKPCIAGRPYACENMGAINFGGVAWDGKPRIHRKGRKVGSFFSQSTFAHHTVVHQNSAVKIDPEFPLKMAGPLGCGIQTGAGIVLNSLKPEVGSSIAVFGCGAVGMSAIMAARIAGCMEIFAVGGNEKSLKLARELGATRTINRKHVEDIPAEIRKIVPEGLNYAIDTSGVESMVRTAMAACCYTGKIVLAGPVQLTIHTGVDLGAKSLIGVSEGDSNPKIFIPQLVEYYKQGRFPIDRLIGYYDFEHIEQAFADSFAGKVIKPVLVRKDI